MCGNELKLGGLGALSPRKTVKFKTSETTYKAKKIKITRIIMVVGNFRGDIPW